MAERVGEQAPQRRVQCHEGEPTRVRCIRSEYAEPGRRGDERRDQRSHPRVARPAQHVREDQRDDRRRKRDLQEIERGIVGELSDRRERTERGDHQQ